MTTQLPNLDTLERLAKAADQSPYTAEDVSDRWWPIGGPWDDDLDQPVPLWWVQREGWLRNDEEEVRAYDEADARYAEAMHPTTTLTMVEELRLLREAAEAAWTLVDRDRLADSVRLRVALDAHAEFARKHARQEDHHA